MRRGVFLIGVTLIAVGAIIALLSVVLSSFSVAIPATSGPSAGQVGPLAVTPPGLVGSGSITMSWNGAPSAFRFQIYQCSDATCAQRGTTPVATGGGSSGTVSFDVNSGTTYVVLAQANTNAVPSTWQLTGLTFLSLIGIVIAIGGGALAFAGYRMKAPRRATLAATEAPEQREMFSTKPFKDLQVGAASQFVGEHSERVRAGAAQPSGPVYFQPSEPEELYGAGDTPTAAPAKGVRPPVKCSYCGEMNEPWITNCRRCRRPMTSTGA
ncbi:MAG: hypothetical protein L3J93_04370 [Thermoplasmata archaeon]|nr:hypothetical protein [Thermoplasmata archaeon]